MKLGAVWGGGLIQSLLGSGECSELGGAAGVALQQPHDGGVALGAFDELLQGQFAWKGEGGVKHNKGRGDASPRSSRIPRRDPWLLASSLRVFYCPTPCPGPPSSSEVPRPPCAKFIYLRPTLFCDKGFLQRYVVVLEKLQQS